MADLRPSQNDSNTYVVLIRLLNQVRSLMQDINAEAEQFNSHLRKQKVLLDENQSSLEDLSAALSDYSDELQSVAGQHRPTPDGSEQSGMSS